MPDGGDDRRPQAAEPAAPQRSEKNALQRVVDVVDRTAGIVAAVAAAVVAIVAAFAWDGWLTGVPALAGTTLVAAVVWRSSAARGGGSSGRTADSTDDGDGLVRASVVYRCSPDDSHPDRWLCRIRTELRAAQSGASRLAIYRPRGPGGAPADLRLESKGHKFLDGARRADPELRWIDLGVPLAENGTEEVAIAFETRDPPGARSSSVEYRVVGPTECLKLMVFLPAQPRRCVAYEKPASGHGREQLDEAVWVEATQHVEFVIEDPRTGSTYVLEWTR